MFDGRTPQIDPDGPRVACWKSPVMPQGFCLLQVRQIQECRQGQQRASRWRVDPVGGVTTESDVVAIPAVGSVPSWREPEG